MHLVTIAKALADTTRVRLVRVLLVRELNVSEVVAVLGMGQSRISRHLKILADAGLVETRRDGSWTFCRAVAEGPERELLDCAFARFGDDPELARDLERARAVVEERARATRRFFDSVAEEWGRLSSDVLGEFDLFAEVVGRMPDGVVAADLGCGPGLLLERMAGRAALTIGVDNAPRMLERAGERFAGRDDVSLRIGELTHLPLGDREADFAVFSMVLHHLPHPDAALAEAARVIRPGGRLVVADFERHGLESMRTEYGDRVLGFEQGDLRRMLDAAGFAVDRADVERVNKGLGVLVVEAIRK